MTEKTLNLPLLSPLFNHLVLEKIISYLNFSDWKSCRLVCTFWNNAVRDTVFNKNTTMYLENSSLEQFLNFFDEDQPLNQNNTHIIPEFENYSIKINSNLSNHPMLDILWDEVGYKLKNLRMEITTRYARTKLKAIALEKTDLLENIKIIVTKFWGLSTSTTEGDERQHSVEMTSQLSEIKPNFNLKSFSYSYLGSLSIFGLEAEDSDSLDFKFPIPWDEFFQRFPNLKSLSLVCMSKEELTEMLSALKALKSKNNQEFSSAELRTLEILDENMCPESPNNSHLESLIELEPLLTEMHLEISPWLKTSLLNTFLEKLSSNLKILKLRRFPIPYQLEVDQITLKLSMKFVTFLEISNDLVPSLEFLPYFPCLETLNVILRDYRSLPPCYIVDNTPTTLEPHQTLKNVFIEPPLLSEDCITNLEKIVPNLQRLKVRMDNEMMWALCGSQSASSLLEELHVISWDGLTDEGFTGIPENVLVNRMRIVDVENYRVYPYIGDLRNLRKLTVEMWTDYSSHISDASLYHGFLDLINLQEFLGIRTTITPEAAARLQLASCTLTE